MKTRLQKTKYLQRPNGHKIAYQVIDGKGPAILFLCGYGANMQGVKANMLKQMARKHGMKLICFDHFGHGKSTGKMKDASISQWINDTKALMQHLNEKEYVMVGSSVGAWIGLNVAKQDPTRIKSFIGIATAFDATEKIAKPMIASNETLSAQFNKHGIVQFTAFDTDYTFTKAMIEDGAQYQLLGQKHNFPFPIDFLHGDADAVAQYQYAQEFTESTRKKTNLTTFKDAGHALNDADQLELLRKLIIRRHKTGQRRSMMFNGRQKQRRKLL